MIIKKKLLKIFISQKKNKNYSITIIKISNIIYYNQKKNEKLPEMLNNQK